jgi:Na+/H+ antiporter NhaC
MDSREKQEIIKRLSETLRLPVLNRYKGWAFVPLLIFLALYIGSGLYYESQGVERAFQQIPRMSALLIGFFCALFLGKEKFEEKTLIFSKAAGDHNVILMVFIFIFSGAFASVSKAMGGVDATVNIGLAHIPTQFVVVGIFVIACFVALSLGTSMGTIATVGPIAVSMAERAGLPVAMTIGAVVGGAMFGDNLSIISDTTIAACRGQGAEMRDKFFMNFKIAIPASVLACLVYVLLGQPVPLEGPFPYEIIKVVPYVMVLVMALAGVDVVIVLLSGTAVSGIIGFYTDSLTWVTFMQAINQGVDGMLGVVAMSLTIKALTGLATVNGGIEWLISLFEKKITTKRRAEFAIAGMVSVIDAAISNNTVAIIIANPIAKEFADKLDISPKRTASILDIFSCVVQGALPHSGQIILASTLASISPLPIIGSLYYQAILGLVSLVAIYFGFPGEKSKT